MAVERAVEAVSAFLRDLPSTPEAGRCRRALARARGSREGPSARWAILQGVREDLKALGYQGVIP